MKRRFVIGDIHGQYDQLLRLLQLVEFDFLEDELITLGDYVDLGPKPFDCIFLLSKIRNLIALRGNHDFEFLQLLREPDPEIDENSFRAKTLSLYEDLNFSKKRRVNQFLINLRNYYVDKNNNLFVHAGLDNTERMEEQTYRDLIVDRSFIKSVIANQDIVFDKIPTIEDFAEIFVGHTTTTSYELVLGNYMRSWNYANVIQTPIHISNVWMMDTGSGKKNGKLTIMNIDTKEITQVNSTLI